ncbi:MAG TPA: uroporphyrinogen decarboxylase family protein [Thermodesulfobacteriota bacterium]|nr:uroporphyrinogen decarboxylase family protein [Thermodesulfobacteriota bacterium]
MNVLSSRERVALALSRKEPDRVPIDLGSIASTIRTVDAYDRLKAHLGLALDKKILHFADEHVIPDEEIVKALHVDTWYLRLNLPKSWARERLDRYTVIDEWGVPWTKAPGSFYTFPSSYPIKTPDLAEIEKFAWPDPNEASRFEGLREKAVRLFRDTRYALIAEGLTGAGIFDMSWHLRGMENILMDMLLHPDFARALFERITDFYCRIYTEYMKAVGDYIEMVIYYEDLSGQDGPLLSPALYRKFIKPCHRRIFRAIKDHTRAKLCVHTCGSVYPFLDEYVELGVDVLNPVQISARDMDPRRLKENYGSALSFQGAIDTQNFLARATPGEVAEEVRRMIRILGRGGGYLLTSCHSIQPDVPPENIVALFESAVRYGKYPLQ